MGYDAGPKAGNADQAENKSSAPFLRPEYENPGQFYRYEYGSRAMFIAGFRRGFLLGYNWAFSKSAASPPAKKVDVGKAKTPDSLPKQITLARDAL